ncbi:hypothetical protein AAG906_040310 [Vitis piasezkii]
MEFHRFRTDRELLILIKHHGILPLKVVLDKSRALQISGGRFPIQHKQRIAEVGQALGNHSTQIVIQQMKYLQRTHVAGNGETWSS